MTRPALTGWVFTDSVAQVACPKCGQPAGKDCRTPKGRKAWPPHNERQTALAEEGAPKEAYLVRMGEDRQAKLNEINREWIKK